MRLVIASPIAPAALLSPLCNCVIRKSAKTGWKKKREEEK
jgi:hypothetical protein